MTKDWKTEVNPQYDPDEDYVITDNFLLNSHSQFALYWWDTNRV